MNRIAIMLLALFFVMPTTTGYTANITGAHTDDTIYVHINAYHSEDEMYNCCEVELTYDVNILCFNPERSTLGCAAYRDTDGKLMLIDFGADKPLGESVYVLAFEVIGTGESTIELCRAAFSTAEKAATQNIEPITNEPNSITVRLE